MIEKKPKKKNLPKLTFTPLNQNWIFKIMCKINALGGGSWVAK